MPKRASALQSTSAIAGRRAAASDGQSTSTSVSINGLIQPACFSVRPRLSIAAP